MKLVILAAAIIIAKTIQDPTYMDTHIWQIVAVLLIFSAWEMWDIYKNNKKQ